MTTTKSCLVVTIKQEYIKENNCNYEIFHQVTNPTTETT